MGERRNEHIPVLLKEVLEIFDSQPGQIYIDATVNGGGHARALARCVGEKGRVIGIDWDCGLIRELGVRNQELGIKNIDVVCENYTSIGKIGERFGVKGGIDGVLFDLGFSSYHIEKSGRGFSFLRDEALDMRYDTACDLTAARIINEWSREALIHILQAYGEERFATRIGEAIVRRRAIRKIVSTAELAEVVVKSLSPHARRGKIHPATRTFQALRIAVNRELENIQKGLEAAVQILREGGKIIVISFHSLEDRLVKAILRAEEKKGYIKVITPKPLRPRGEELLVNPRARSAKLRALVRIK